MISLPIFVFFEGSGHHRDLHVLTHSFPTRLSADLAAMDAVAYRQPRLAAGGENPVTLPGDASIHRQTPSPLMTMGLWHHGKAVTVQSSVRMARSEEHTSELQSLMRQSYAVFCLKKKKSHNNNIYTHKRL